jgi:hypothetical protein
MAAEFEDGFAGNPSYEEGDWNNDGDLDSTDFVFTFQAGPTIEGPKSQSKHRLDFPSRCNGFQDVTEATSEAVRTCIINARLYPISDKTSRQPTRR